MRRLRQDILEGITVGSQDYSATALDVAIETVEILLEDDSVVEAVFKSVPDDWVCKGDAPTKFEFVIQYVFESLGIA